MERNLAPLWRGMYGISSSSSRSNNDYERACEIKDYAGVVDILEGHAIVLGDMPLTTTAWSGVHGQLIVRAFFMDPAFDVQSAVEQAGEEDFGNAIESILFTVYQENIIIFDSALSGSYLDHTDVVSIYMHAGQYKILTYEFKPDVRTSLLLHRFCPFT